MTEVMRSLSVRPAEDYSQRNISNSEVTTWLSCRQQYYFAFVLNLAPKITPKALSRGTIGHEAFSVYIQHRLSGETHESSLQGSMSVFLEYTKRGASPDVVMETQFLYMRYMEAHDGWPEWTLLGTEERKDLKITDYVTIPIRYDLMVQDKASGRVLIGDFKFSYDFWRPWEHDLNVQLPKYIAVMNANGIPVHGGFLEEVRTRKLGKEKSADPRNLWRRTPYNPPQIKQRIALKQHIAASLEIQDYRALPEPEREARTIPVYNKFGPCKFCNFEELCNSSLTGKTDLTVDIETGYVTNTYGYNEPMNMEDIL